MESRTQGSRPRPRTQKNPRPRPQKKSEAKDSLSEDRHSRGQGQECSRLRPRTKDTSASVLRKKRSSKIIFQAFSSKKRLLKSFFRRSTKVQLLKKKCCPRAEDRPIFKNLRPEGQGLDLRGRGQGLQSVSSRPRTSSQTPPDSKYLSIPKWGGHKQSQGSRPGNFRS